MKEFWDDRYVNQEYVYGTDPNQFLRSVLKDLEPGRILFPADGEGRNSVYAATQGWNAYAFDWSQAGKEKAEKLAEESGVKINYRVMDFSDLDYPPDFFDGIALIYTHFTTKQKRKFLTGLENYLKPGGTLIMEVFSKGHIEYQRENAGVGGPRDEDLLYSIEEIKDIFSDLTIKMVAETEVTLQEGKYHNGTGLVIRMIAEK